VKEIKADLVIIRDLPLAPTALLVGRLYGCPVLMDMAENYPAMISDTWRYRGPNRVDYLVRNPSILRFMEKLVVPHMDGILTVSEHSKERVEMLGVESSKIWVVSNTPKLDCFSSTNNLDILRDEIRKNSSFILTYVGGMEESRGLDMVIRALVEVQKIISDVKFVIVGTGTSETKLRALTKELGVQDHVFFTGWMDNCYVPSIIKLSDVCIVPHYVTEHTDTTVPNKIFDYMIQKKPVVATNSKALSEIVCSSNCGKIYVHDNWKDLAKKIVELKTPSVRRNYGANGYKSVLNRYNWSIDEKNLFWAVNTLSSLRYK